LFNAKYKTISAENFAIVVHRAGNILKNMSLARGGYKETRRSGKKRAIRSLRMEVQLNCCRENYQHYGGLPFNARRVLLMSSLWAE
jgi:hypothetical protein